MILLLKVHGAEIVQGRVPVCGIAKALDVIEEVLSCVVARNVTGTIRYFVRAAGYRHQMTNRSPKITAN